VTSQDHVETSLAKRANVYDGDGNRVAETGETWGETCGNLGTDGTYPGFLGLDKTWGQTGRSPVFVPNMEMALQFRAEK
jgi:hypothetical protein